MGNRTRLGSLRTAHTVTAIHPSFAGVFNCTNAQAIRKYSTFSSNGTSNPGSNLYTYVNYRNVTYSGTTYDVALNWGISVAVNDTVYFNWRENGIQVSKANVDATAGDTRKLLLDSRIRRRGQIYAMGSGINNNNAINFKGSKSELGYIPLVVTGETNSGEATYSTGGNDEDYTTEASQFIFTKTTLTPAEAAAEAEEYGGTDKAIVAGRSQAPNVANLNFKVLRIPCAYGYMTSANFDNPTTTSANGMGTNTSPAVYKQLGKKRVLSGKLSNSTAGYSNIRGLYVSREGTDIESCNKDDFLFASDTGVINDEIRGEAQNLAVNYSTVVSSSAVPSPVAITNINSSSSGSISVFNPYSLAPAVSTSYSNAASNQNSSVSLSSSVSNGLYSFTFSTTSSSTLSLTSGFNIQLSSLALL